MRKQNNMAIKKHKHFLWQWWFDIMITYGGLVGSMVSLPQLLKIWIEHDSAGVSLITWCGFFFANFVWFIYGIVHNEKPVIFAHMLGIPLSFAIVVGILLYR